MAERQQWFGEKTCDICGKEIKGVLYDACRKDTPEWATMCRKCYRFYGSPIGWGSGQKYEEENGEFYLVAGGEPEENDSAKVDQDISVNDILRMFFKS
jgi:ribosome-binding protein aMBF1 (putative translation factor)